MRSGCQRAAAGQLAVAKVPEPPPSLGTALVGILSSCPDALSAEIRSGS